MQRAALLGRDDHGDGAHALLAADSTWNFDQLVGAVSLNAYVPLLRAQLLSLRGNAGEALELYEKHLQTGLSQGLGSLQGNLMADLAWCRAKLGHTDAARQDALAAEESLQLGTVDDRALGFGRLAEAFGLLGDKAAATRNENLAATMWQAHTENQRLILEALSLVVVDVGPI